MSNLVSALPGAVYEGFVRVEEQGLCGMITLRGDFNDAKFKKAVKSLTGVAVPAQTSCTAAKKHSVAWMSPDELLILCPYAEAEALCAKISTALAGTHHLVANVSDARAQFQLHGAAVRDVLSKLIPTDLSEAAMPVGAFRRSRLAQAPAAFWFSDAQTAHLVCFRSQAEYVFGLLSRAAMSGSEL